MQTGRRTFIWMALLFLLLGSALSLAVLKLHSKPTIGLSLQAPQVLDLGFIAPREVKSEKFLIKNNSMEPVSVKQIEVSCGCTSVSLQKSLIAPGQSVWASVSVTAKPVLGRIMEEIVFKGKTSDLLLKITILGNVVTPLAISPEIVDFGVLSRVSLPRSEILVVSAGEITKIPPDLVVLASDSFVSITKQPSDPGRLVFSVNLGKEVPDGDIIGTVYLNSTSLRTPIPVRFAGKIVDSYSSEPEAMFFSLAAKVSSLKKEINITGLNAECTQWSIYPERLKKLMEIHPIDSKRIELTANRGVISQDEIIDGIIYAIVDDRKALSIPVYYHAQL